MKITKKLKEWAAYHKDLLNGTIATIIGGIIVALVMMELSGRHELYKDQQNKLAFLNQISIGQARNYIDEKLDAPVVSALLPNYSTDKKVADGDYSNAGYKFKNCVILCLYRNDSLAAFTVVVNKRGVYKIPFVSSLSHRVDNKTLLSFKYSDAVNSLTINSLNYEPWILGYSTTGNAYNAYAEIYSGAHIDNFNACIIGSYQYYPSETADLELYSLYDYAFVIMNYQKGNNILGSDEESLQNITHMYQYILDTRKKRYPNLFGIISSDLVQSFDFVADIVQDDSRAELLFGDWN